VEFLDFECEACGAFYPFTTVIALGAITGFAMAGISHRHFHSSPRSARGETDA